MRLAATCVPTLPPLAWLCLLPVGGGAELRHGEHVQLMDDGFFEGAWAGPFAEAGFDRADAVFGSGGKPTAEGMRFVTPSHTGEPLYVLRRRAGAAVSNSLPFLLAHGDLELDPCDWEAPRRFASISRGLDRVERIMFLPDAELELVYVDDFVLDAGGAVRRSSKPAPPDFPDYRSYLDYLDEAVAAVFANADDPGRSSRYRPLATLSSGYDTTACAAISSRHGCREAVSIVTARGGGSDSGREIAAALGLSLSEFERIGPARRDDGSEDEFLAAGMQGEDYVFKAFEDAVGGRVLITGILGGLVWDKYLAPNDVIGGRDLSGQGLGEFRLRRNFVHMPLPYIGCRKHSQLNRLSHSEEMQPYRLGGAYDRPIARRIAEEAGVPRAVFGQKNRATSIHLFRDPRLLSAIARRELADYQRGIAMSAGRRLAYYARSWLWNLGYAFNMSAGKAARRAGLGRRLARLFPYCAYPNWFMFEHAHPRNTIWQNWAISRLKRRYAAAAAPAGAESPEPDARAGVPAGPA